MNTARFSKVVERSGKPVSYTLWTDPKNDAEFQRALKAQRVMTVHQETVGSRTDYGTVGFFGDKRASLLIFPKSLAPFVGKRVVGIKYDLLEPPQPATSGKASSAAEKPKVLQRATHGKPSELKEAKVKPAEKRLETNVIPFAEEEKSEPATSEQVRSKSRPLNLQREVQKVTKALKAGRVVAAYEMLEQIEATLARDA